MPYENRAEIIGHVGKEIEIRSMNSGDRVATFSVATTEKWKKKDGGEGSKTTWHRIVVFKQPTVGFLEKYAGKGSTVRVVGKIEHRDWEDKDGNKKTSTEIVVNGFEHKVDLFGSKKEEDTQPSLPSTGGASYDDSDIPFAPIQTFA